MTTPYRSFHFDFETMDVYRVALEVARHMRAREWPSPQNGLRDQGIRAADSVVLNIAEGLGRGGKAGKNHFRIARGSAGAVRRVGAMLTRMAQ